MSHMSKNKVEGLDKTKISLEVATRAVLEMERAMLGLRVSTVSDYYGKRDGTTRACKGIGFKMHGDEYGVDLTVTKTGMSIETESMNHLKARFEHEFQKAYTAVLAATALGKDGYTTRVTSQNLGGQTTRVAYKVTAERA